MNQKFLIAALIVLAAVAVWYFAMRSPDAVDNDNYVGNSPEECARVEFLCIEGYERFDDANGCGCRLIAE